MLARARAGADVVLASVHGGGGPRGRRPPPRRASRAPRPSPCAAPRGSTRAPSPRSSASTARGSCAAATRPTGDSFIREGGFACKAEILAKLDRLGARVEEVPVDLDASRRVGESKLRVLPTMGGYARLMARQLTDRRERPA